MNIKFVCEKCGKEPKRNEKLSNENWDVIDNKPCSYCGGEITIEVSEANDPHKKSRRR